MNRADQAEEAIFNAARLFSDAAKLSAYLDLACEGNPGLRRRIERLLGAATGADNFFQRNSAAVKQLIAPLEACVSIGGSASESLGTVIGRYKLLEKIGFTWERRHPCRQIRGKSMWVISN